MDDFSRCIDLHLHTTASDGVLTPSALMRLAGERGLAAAAVTDHDTVDGLAEAAAAARTAGVEFVPGIEISAAHAPGTMHILGYFIDPASTAIERLCRRMIAGRQERNARIVQRLAAIGRPIRLERVLELAGGGVVGRPHIARAMVEAGHVKTLRQAFSHYLAKGCPAYMERDRLDPAEAIGVIRQAGGVACLAHPPQLGCRTYPELQTLAGRLVDHGLGAIEVHHPDHKPLDTRMAMMLAARWRLASTGGSDFHGPFAPPGREVGFCGLKIPYNWVENLRRRR